jgi:hypothetical protein
MASMTTSQYVFHRMVSTDLTKIKPFTTHFPRADIHKMLSADLLHQIIKGTFKDHLVQWIADYLHITHGETRANNVLDDIDRR